MDLDYPSYKKNQLSREINQVDRRYGSVILSNPKLTSDLKPLSEKIKRKVLKIIQNNKHLDLLRLLTQKQMSLTNQISKQGLSWTILHCIAKQNAGDCMDICLRWLYQNCSRDYEHTVNLRNSDQDTPLMIACMNKANSVVKIILDYGLVDIYLINLRKLTAYQIALTSTNEEILQMLMKYQIKVKSKTFIDKDKLSVSLPSLASPKMYQIYRWLTQCLSFGQLGSNLEENKESQTDTDRPVYKQSRQQISNIQIDWLEPDKVYSQQLPLFSNVSQPFLIKQSNVIVSNLLIIFQAFAEHPELLKRIIIPTNKKYLVRLGGQNREQIIHVDNIFPFRVDTKESLFLWLSDQLWPMVLQKALSQYFNGFFEPAKVPIQQIIQTISGNQSYTIYLDTNEYQSRQQKKELIQKIQSKNCVMILKAKPDCPLKPAEGRLQCFSLLKVLGGNKFLINCPFLFAEKPTNESNYTIQMKLAMSHYQNQNCTTIWVDQSQFFSYFSEAVFCHILGLNSMKPSTCKFKSEQGQAYLLIKIRDKIDKQKIFLTFKNSLMQPITPLKCMAWMILGKDRANIQKINVDILGMVQLSGVNWPCEILLMCEFQEIKPKDSIQILCRSSYSVPLEPLDCVIGDLEFLECCKKYYKQNYTQFTSSVFQTVGDYVLAMVVSEQKCFIPLPASCTQDNTIQGLYVQTSNKLEMFKFGNINYAILTDIKPEILKSLKILTQEISDEESESESEQESKLDISSNNSRS